MEDKLPQTAHGAGNKSPSKRRCYQIVVIILGELRDLGPPQLPPSENPVSSKTYICGKEKWVRGNVFERRKYLLQKFKQFGKLSKAMSEREK
ncbi:unnamed protein product [Arabis nemorensis]|uniref:Uncharacterized protein n=1 Tax=Arabis nemorensis TaxID=586526 RepID=A0A565C3Y2_9BRAS|nr:unnamed protein product [Arabis nemorensis]